MIPYRGIPDDGVMFLPTDSLKKVLVGMVFVQDDCNYEEMMIDVIRAIINSGHHEDAIKWGYSQGDSIIVIYKQVPVLKIFNHLNAN